jgi:hypothetical protein
MRAFPRSISCGLLLSLGLTLLASAPSWAEPMAFIGGPPRVGVAGDAPFSEERAKPMALLGIGPRYGFGGDSPLGEEQKENFQMYDVAALFRLPWSWWQRSGSWGLETRLIASAGELTAAGTGSFIATLVPALAVTSRNGGVAVDVGMGAGFFSNYKFGVQDFGGPAQIVGTAGIGFNLLPGFHTGYRFQHFSDAGLYGGNSLGVDMHILEIAYRF